MDKFLKDEFFSPSEIEIDEEIEFGLEVDDCELNPEESCFRVILDTSNLDDCEVNKIEFQKGINSVSHLCGAISALVNVGVKPEDALTYISSQKELRDVLANNISVAELQAKSAVETSKNRDFLSSESML